MFIPLKDQVALLKKHAVPMDKDYLTEIENNKALWDDTKNKVNNVKA